MIQIPLTQGYTAVIDDADMSASLYNWHANIHRRRDGSIKAVYAVRKGPKGKRICLHRFLLGVTDFAIEVDHREDNGMVHGLDNRRSNLRVCTHIQNRRNTNKILALRSSQYKGVGWDKGKRLWQARIGIAGKNRFIGRFKSEIEAALAYDAAAKKYFVQFARLNF
jgi:hypothetical protein